MIEERLPADPERDVLAFGDIEIDRRAKIVRRNGAPLALTPKEYDLLVALVDRCGQAVSRRELMQDVWEYDPSVVSRTVDTHVAELRRKLEANPGAPRYILTVRKVGYRLNASFR